MNLWVWMSQQYWNLNTLIHSYSLQDWFIIQVAMIMSTTLTSNSYHSKYVWFICLLYYNTHKWFEWRELFTKIDSLSCCCCIYKKKRKKKTKTASKAIIQLLLLSIVVFVCESNLFCDSCKFHGELKSTTSWVLLSTSTMSTSNLEYEYCEYDIKISRNAYKYQKLWVWLEFTHRFVYSLLISVQT